MRLFGWSGKFYFPEIEIRWPQKKAFDHGNAFTLLFFLQSISRKWERERERARARAQEEKIQSEIACSNSSPRSRRRDRDLREIASAIAISRRLRSRRRSWSREEGEISIAPSIAISPRDRAVDRAVVGLETFSSLMIFFFFWVVACVFWFVFSFFFSKHQKIFSGKFFETQPNTWKYFHFPEISISGKYVFSRKRFTATKHSLKILFFQEIEVINNNWDNTFLFFKRDRTIV